MVVKTVGVYMFKYYATNVFCFTLISQKKKKLGIIIISQKKGLKLDVNLVIRKRMVLGCSATSTVVLGGSLCRGN